jgi:hypothetical protein
VSFTENGGEGCDENETGARAIAEKLMSKWLGHADPAFTLRTYVHLVDEGVRWAALGQHKLCKLLQTRTGRNHSKPGASGDLFKTGEPEGFPSAPRFGGARLG